MALRAALLAARRARPAAERQAAADRLVTALTEVVRARQPATVAAYVPVGTEPGGPAVPAALAAALPPGGRLLLPVLLPDLDLDWAGFDPAAGLAPAGRGLREPVGRRLGVHAVADADLVIVPALAVDRRGVRLGRGGGSYDRALCRVGAGALTVALLYDDELLVEVPTEPHDRRVRATVTPSAGLVRLVGG